VRAASKKSLVTNSRFVMDLGLNALKAGCLVLALQMAAVADECSDGCQAESRNGHFQVVAEPDRGSIPLREYHDWIVNIRGTDGGPVQLDGLSVSGGMPGHGHGLPSQPKVQEYLGDGRYRLSGFLFNMHGDWTLRIHMVRRGVQDVADLKLTLDY